MNRIKILFLSVVAVLAVSCGGTGSDADNKLGKLDVEIPDELKENKEVVEFIENMAEVSDEYALMIDDVLEDVGDLAGKDESELGMMDKMKLLKATGEITIGSAEIMSKWGEYMEKRADLGEQLSDNELKALESVMNRFEKRMEQIQEKYGELSGDDSNE